MWWLLLLSSVAGLRTLEPPAPPPVSRNQVVEGWLPVRLNHFDASNTETFQMRYFYNPDLKNATSGTHIVIFVGGEWAISAGWVQAGLPYDLASEIGAGLFYTEHRYYGLTRPSTDTSVEDLRYLNVDQAIGDLVQFIQHVKSDDFEDGYYRNATVSLVGCSYAGSMATWARLGYPHLVTAAFSDSGPLRAQEDFPEYLEVITEALRTQGGQACVDAVGEAVDMMLELITTTAGVQRVSELFNTCSLLQSSSPLDVATFFWFGITETFAYLVQYATPGNIPAACSIITGSQGDPVERLSTWITSQPWTQPCIETRYQEVLAGHTNTSYDAPDAVMRLWTYQTCVEYGWYQTTTSSDQPFRDTVPLEYFHQMCRDFFGEMFTPTFLRAGISRTNLLWGSQLPDRVVSVAGGADPWSPVGPNASDAHQHAPVYVVDGVSHCRAVSSLGNSETEELEKTKQAVVDHMVYWTTGRSLPSGAGGLTASVLLLAIALLVQ
ncbi:putative serine protease K12H4.7 [Aricia agestis]|uniref:putative serine protease K12H4.7 n=1 Tax=Aricia agestis TaxID=91739 RepID=UPI001C204066|nr:putative serine protease K12H4.7 [Aricia agestis]